MGEFPPANTKVQVSIIVPNFNGKNLLKECLDSIKNLHYDNYEVIVVDNSSTDGSAEMVRNEYPWATVLVTERIKISQACNRGMRLARGDVLVTMLNNDMTVDRWWLDHLVIALAKRDIGIVGGRVYKYGSDLVGPTRIDWEKYHLSSSFISSMIRLRNRYAEREKERYDASHDAFHDALHEVDYVEVPTLRRDVMNVIGGIDEEYEFYFHDSDYCLRAKRAGYRVVYVPSAVSWHRIAATVGAQSRKAYYANRKDSMRFVIKHSGPRLVLFCVYRRILYVVLSSLWNLLRRTRRTDMVMLNMKALLWNLVNLRQTLCSRRRRWL